MAKPYSCRDSLPGSEPAVDSRGIWVSPSASWTPVTTTVSSRATPASEAAAFRASSSAAMASSSCRCCMSCCSNWLMRSASVPAWSSGESIRARRTGNTVPRINVVIVLSRLKPPVYHTNTNHRGMITRASAQRTINLRGNACELQPLRPHLRAMSQSQLLHAGSWANR